MRGPSTVTGASRRRSRITATITPTSRDGIQLGAFAAYYA